MQDEKNNIPAVPPENDQETSPQPSSSCCGNSSVGPGGETAPCCQKSVIDSCGHCASSAAGDDGEMYFAVETDPGDDKPLPDAGGSVHDGPVVPVAADTSEQRISSPASVLPETVQVSQTSTQTASQPPSTLPENQKLVGIRFKLTGELYFVPDEAMELKAGERVVVKLAKGKDAAEVVMLDAPANSKISDPQLRIIRKINKNDLIQEQQNQQREKEAFNVCQNKIKKLELPMKLLSVKYLFDGSRVTFYFKADSKVDFRKLVRELAFVFRTRIELRQIGPRDETELFGGLGICGRRVCCNYWNCRAKTVLNVDTQRSPFLNLQGMQGKVLGLCSRPLCCLRYEGDVPVAVAKPAIPPMNAKLTIDEQNGVLKFVDEKANQVAIQIEGDEVELNISYEEFLLKLQEGKIKVVRDARKEPRESLPAPEQHSKDGRDRGEHRPPRDSRPQNENSSRDNRGGDRNENRPPRDNNRGDNNRGGDSRPQNDNRPRDNNRGDRGENRPPRDNSRDNNRGGDNRGGDSRPQNDNRPRDNNRGDNRSRDNRNRDNRGEHRPPRDGKPDRPPAQVPQPPPPPPPPKPPSPEGKVQ